MANNPQGRPDRDMDETRPRLTALLPPNDAHTFTFAICLRKTGDLVGIGGCHALSSMFGWPAIGYMLRREGWGQGLATEFLTAWLSLWRALPREAVELHVDPLTLSSGVGAVSSPEQLTAFTVSDNVASQRVLEKTGFSVFMTRTEPDLRNPTVDVELRGYSLAISATD